MPGRGLTALSASVNSTNKSKETALHMASYRGYQAVATGQCSGPHGTLVA